MRNTGEITLKNGRIEQSNFNDYQVVRIDESPTETRTHIVEQGLEVPSSGVGEPGVLPFAPALCNAIFAATGKRIRHLPILPFAERFDLRMAAVPAERRSRRGRPEQSFAIT